MRAAAALLPVALLGGCDLSMKDQPRDDRMGSATLWPHGPARQAPPAGTISEAARAGAQALAHPPPLTSALLDRGQQQYRIYCSPCHGERGDGDGVIVRHGFPAPPSYHVARLRAASPAYIVGIITRGYGVMYDYSDRVAPADRWAIAAYVKVLQLAGPGRGAK